MHRVELPVVDRAPKYVDHPYPGDIEAPLRFTSVTLFLNRDCPRRCEFCGIADASREALPIDQWIEALTILKEVFGVKFFLFLGTEPLLYRKDLIKLVDWFTKNHPFYGFYSTSPEPLFSQYKQQLVDAGLNNWSAGIDGLPWSPMDKITAKKVRESIAGMQWMAERGVQTHTLTTIHKKNLNEVVEVMTWCQDNIPGCQSSLNFVEWRKDSRFDFFSWPEDMQDYLWDGSDEERAQVRAMLDEVTKLSRQHGRIIQAPDHFLANAHLDYDKLSTHCKWSVGPAVDADGTMRICGYSRDDEVGAFNVFELRDPDRLREFTRTWRQSVGRCSGCHWIWPEMLQSDLRILDPRSGFHQDRWANAAAKVEACTKNLPTVPAKSFP